VQTQAIVNAGALEGLQMLSATGNSEEVKKMACWAVSNIMAGNMEQIQAAIDAKLLPPLVQIMASSAAREVRRWACWAISNATSGGTAEQIYALLRAAVVPQLAGMAASGDEPKIALVALEGLENILRAAPAVAAAGLMPHADLLDLFEQAGRQQLHAKARGLTAFLEAALRERLDGVLQVVTPSNARGCQLSLRVRAGRETGRRAFDRLTALGIAADWREPDIIRVAAVPLYNRYEDLALLLDALERALLTP
jgi:kynureninase